MWGRISGRGRMWGRTRPAADAGTAAVGTDTTAADLGTMWDDVGTGTMWGQTPPAADAGTDAD